MANPPESGTEVWLDLNRKFSSNLILALTQDADLVSIAETRARAVPVVARILREEQTLTGWQGDALCMFDEVFADLVCSIYLAGCGLDKPAQATLRRALEVGVATVYVWDLPHVFYNWKNYDRDLNFNDMLDHFANPGFLSFVKSQNIAFRESALVDATLARSLYRDLSNIVHGKMTSFESLLPDRFLHNERDWRSHLEKVGNVERLLFQLWEHRFESVSRRLHEEFPQLRMKEAGEYGL
jgi:hypothetical protein